MIIISSTISKKIAVFINLSKKVRKNVLFILNYLKLEKLVESVVQNCVSVVDPSVILQTRKILPSTHKDAVAITQQSLVVY